MTSTELQQLADSFYKLSEKSKAAAKKANDEHFDLLRDLEDSFFAVHRQLGLAVGIKKDIEEAGVTI
jgi:hypothetical protein